MNNSPKVLTGVMKTDNIDYCFHLSDYNLLLLDNVVNSQAKSTLTPVDGFAQATTHEGSKMLIHVGNHSFTVMNTMPIDVSSYIVSRSNVWDYDISYFDGIKFVGGTLRNLKVPMGIKIGFSSEAYTRTIEYLDDTQTFSFAIENLGCTVTIGSSTMQHHGITESGITNGNIYFLMEFDRSQETSKFYLHYNKVLELLSFLVNRCNVGFDEVYLLQKDKRFNNTLGDVAQVFIKQDKELTRKRIFQNLEFDMMGESLGKLLRTLYIPKEHSLSIFPEDDESSMLINNNMVRGVCSALECELNFIDEITSSETEKIKRLVKKIKEVLKEHKKGDEKLEDRTYSLISSSMSHWSMSASDRIKALFHMYDEEMTILNEANYVLGDEEIHAFVKYRNEITHGSYRVLEPTVAYTTHLLAGLVYCCVLSRIGIPREKITQWCKDRRLNN